MEAFIQPLQALLNDLHFSVDEDLDEFRRRIAHTRIASFRGDALDILSRVSNPSELRAFIDFCEEELKSL